MLKYILTVLLLIPLFASSQLKVSGKTVHYLTQKKLPLSQINVINKTDGSRFSVVLSKGNYKVKLERDNIYDLEFTKSGYYSKFVQVDTRGIPTNKSVVLYIEMDMVEDALGIDQTFFNQPMGKCAYSPVLKQMEWDLEYSKMMFEKLNDEYARLGSKEKSADKDVDSSLGNAEPQMDQIEPEVVDIANPFYLAEPIKEYISVSSFSTRSQVVEFKWLFSMGMHFSKLALNADQNDIDSKIATIKGIQNDANKVLNDNPIDFKPELIRLANNSSVQDSIDYVQYDVYTKLRDQLLVNNKEAFYIETGSLIESIYQAVLNYEKKPNSVLNEFIAESRNEFYNYYLLFRTYGKQIDAALSFNTEMTKVEAILKQINLVPRTERIQDDPSDSNFKYKITPELLKALKQQLEGIRSNFL